jgi:hypothetical protein
MLKKPIGGAMWSRTILHNSKARRDLPFRLFDMIHFDFIVSDEEAENIFDAINQQISESSYIVFFGEDKHKEWHRGRLSFLQELSKKMTNTKVS